MPASLSMPPRLTQSEFQALSSDPFFWEEEGRFADGLLIAALLMVVAGGLVGFCVTPAGL